MKMVLQMIEIAVLLGVLTVMFFAENTKAITSSNTNVVLNPVTNANTNSTTTNNMATNTATNATASVSVENKLLERRIQQRKFFTVNEILDMQQESKQLFKEDRVALYNKYYKSEGEVLGAFILNFFIPGTGNLLLGDYVGGCILLPAAVTSGVLLFVSIFKVTSYPANMIMGVSSMAGLSVSYFFGWITPFTHANDWNDRLRLGMNVIPEKPQKIKSASKADKSVSLVEPENLVELTLLAYRF